VAALFFFLILIFFASFLLFSLIQKKKKKKEIIELIVEAKPSALDSHGKKLIEAVLSFKDRTAKEIMVPKTDLFSLPAEMSIKEAAKILHSQGFSRTPVYESSLDNIVGILMYKDLLSKYMEYERSEPGNKILEAPIRSIQKSPFYAPETKKISSLLQDFRKKQMHLAIIVDEYGSTEGIVTIEDILEEIVGDISDEYDEEEKLYRPHGSHSWIVDAKMNILDIEEKLGISIPQEANYGTLSGFIYQKAGKIPLKGFIIHQDDFEIEVLSSTEKAVEKVKITPFSS